MGDGMCDGWMDCCFGKDFVEFGARVYVWVDGKELSGYRFCDFDEYNGVGSCSQAMFVGEFIGAWDGCCCGLCHCHDCMCVVMGC